MKITLILFVILVIISVSHGRNHENRKPIHRGIQNQPNDLLTHKQHHDTVGDSARDAYDDPDDNGNDDTNVASDENSDNDSYEDPDENSDNDSYEDPDENSDNDSYEDLDGNSDGRDRNLRRPIKEHRATNIRSDDHVIYYYHDTIGGSDEDNDDDGRNSYDDSDDSDNDSYYDSENDSDDNSNGDRDDDETDEDSEEQDKVHRSGPRVPPIPTSMLRSTHVMGLYEKLPNGQYGRL